MFTHWEQVINSLTSNKWAAKSSSTATFTRADLVSEFEDNLFLLIERASEMETPKIVTETALVKCFFWFLNNYLHNSYLPWKLIKIHLHCLLRSTSNWHTLSDCIIHFTQIWLFSKQVNFWCPLQRNNSQVPWSG